MIIDLQEFKKGKIKKEKPGMYVAIPIVSRVYEENGKLIGELIETGRKIVLREENE